jgi:hypothetical protein
MTVEIMPGFTLTDIETSGARIRLRQAAVGRRCFCFMAIR